MSNRAFWGADIGGTTTIVGSISGSTGFRRLTVLETRPSEGPGRLLAGLSSAILAADPEPVSVGIGIAGLVDRSRGWLEFSPNLPGWEGLDVSSRVGSLTGAPVVVDNDCNAFAYGAVSTGFVPSVGLQVLVTLGTGIGGTIIDRGRILYGTGYAGEFGHMPVEALGRACPCGSTGCWERYAGREALIGYFTGRDGGAGGPDPREMAALAADGDAGAVAAFATFGRWVGTGLAGLANCLSPEGFFLAGGLSNTADLFLPSAREEFGRRTRHPWSVAILPGSSDAGALGAALMARDSTP